jgi:hypothetical protein
VDVLSDAMTYHDPQQQYDADMERQLGCSRRSHLKNALQLCHDYSCRQFGQLRPLAMLYLCQRCCGWFCGNCARWSTVTQKRDDFHCGACYSYDADFHYWRPRVSHGNEQFARRYHDFLFPPPSYKQRHVL